MEILFFAVVVLVGIGSLVWHFSRSRAVLEQWAAQNGFRLVEAKMAYFFRGPFFWTTSKGQSVYRVTVVDAAGRTRQGWVRCGSWMWGLLSDQAQVHWEDE